MFDLVPRANSVAETAATHAAEVDRGSFPTETIAALAEAGLLGLISSQEVGGRGRPLADAALVVERLARECGSSAMVLCMHYCAAAVIEAQGPLEVRKAIAAGKHLSTLAFSEVGSRSHFWASLGTAIVDGDQVRLDGKKSWVTSAHHADSYVWSSKPLTGDGVSSLWLVPRQTSGLRIMESGFDGLGLRGNDSCPVSAEAARLPASARLGEDGAGFATMMGVVLPWFSVLSAAVSAGLMEAAVTKTVAHVTATRLTHLNSSIVDLPTVRAYIARMRIQTDQTKALIRDSVEAITSGRPDATLRVLEVKAASGENATAVTDLAMRVCGSHR
jgi:alkylation response protein AidB-like acyl-CoA dehydrogenase